MSWGQAAGQLLSAYSASQSGGSGSGSTSNMSGGTDLDRRMSSNRMAAPFIFQPNGGNSGLTTWQWVAIGTVGLGGLWILTSGGR